MLMIFRASILMNQRGNNMRFLGKNKQGQEIFGYDFVDHKINQMADNQISIVGSTEALDRDGEIIKMAGWQLDNYMKNPIILPAHMYWEPAIGKGAVRIDNNKLVFDITFPDKGINPVADVYRGLYKGGFMNACSVGFIGIDYTWGEKDGDPRRTYEKQELLELSLCSVPSNPQALVTDKSFQAAVKAGAIRKDDVKALEDFIGRCFKPEAKTTKYFSINKEDPSTDDNQLECPSCGDSFDEEDGITGDEVGTACMRCPLCGAVNDKDEYGPVEPKTAKGVYKQSHLNAKRIKTIVEETIKEVIPGIVAESLETILKNKSHYSSILFKDQVSSETTESLTKELGVSLTNAFKK